MAIAVGDSRARSAQTLEGAPNGARRRTANSGPATSCEKPLGHNQTASHALNCPPPKNFLPAPSVHMLWRWYLQTKPMPKVADFALEVSACAAYYSSKHLCNLRNHWSTPLELAERLSLTVSAEWERFSSER